MASRPNLPFEEANGKIIEISYEHFRINGQLPHRHFFLGREKFKLEQRPINAWKKKRDGAEVRGEGTRDES